jgi:hypothetical protein
MAVNRIANSAPPGADPSVSQQIKGLLNTFAQAVCRRGVDCSSRDGRPCSNFGP